ncbi:Reverse transcriptase [Theobroma cacao]|nr:Reverse transcriptase [Theobroma cacao]
MALEGSKSVEVVSSHHKIVDVMLAGDGLNFVEWKSLVKVNVRGLGNEAHLTEPCPEKEDAAKVWMIDDGRLFSQIFNCIDRKMVLSMQHTTTIKELQELLHGCFSGTKNMKILYSSSQKVSRPSQNGRTIIDYYYDYKRANEDFYTALLLSTDVAKKKEQCGKLFVFSWLSSLNSEYDVIHSQLLANKDVSSLFDVVTTVLSVTKESVFATSDVSDRSALVSQGTNGFGSGYRGGSGGGKGNFRGGRGGKGASGCGASQVSDSTTPSTEGHTIIMSDEEFSTYIQFQKSQQPSFSSTATLVKTGNPTASLSSSSHHWVIDSSATDHMTGNSGILSTYRHSNLCPNVTLANGSTTKVLEIRTQFHSNIRILRSDNCGIPTGGPTPSLPSFIAETEPADGFLIYIVSNLSLDTLSLSSQPPITQVYTHCHGTDAALLQLVDTSSDSILIPTSTSVDSDLDLPIALQKTLTETLSYDGWQTAMEEEMLALETNSTWNLISLPSAATHHWPVDQLDEKNAFLHINLQEEVCMEQPPGFVAQGDFGKVCKLRISVYGLKQSPRAWFERFSDVVLEFGLLQSSCDHTMFFRHTDNGCILRVVYVDDIVITGSDEQGNLVSWKSKKQNVVSRSSAESEYCTVAQTTCKLMRIHHLLEEIGFSDSSLMRLWCDNQATMHISSNPVFHESTKHLEVDCHFVREKIQQKLISTSYVSRGEQLADLFTKNLSRVRIDYICNKRGMINIYAPA